MELTISNTIRISQNGRLMKDKEASKGNPKRGKNSESRWMRDGTGKIISAEILMLTLNNEEGIEHWHDKNYNYNDQNKFDLRKSQMFREVKGHR